MRQGSRSSFQVFQDDSDHYLIYSCKILHHTPSKIHLSSSIIMIIDHLFPLLLTNQPPINHHPRPSTKKSLHQSLALSGNPSPAIPLGWVLLLAWHQSLQPKLQPPSAPPPLSSGWWKFWCEKFRKYIMCCFMEIDAIFGFNAQKINVILD